MCVCVWGVNDQKEFGIYECEKGKGKEDVRRLSASVMNSPSPFVQGYIGVATVLAYARITHHGTCLQSLYGI